MKTSTVVGEQMISLKNSDEIVRNLPAESKQALIGSLIRDALLVTGGNSLIQIQSIEGESLGYLVPPRLAKEQMRHLGIVFGPEKWKSLQQAIDTPDDCFDPLELNETADLD